MPENWDYHGQEFVLRYAHDGVDPQLRTGRLAMIHTRADHKGCFFLDLENYNSSHAPLYIVQGNKNQDLFKFTMNLPYEINVYKNMSIRVIRLHLFLEYDKLFSAESLKIVLLLRCHSTFF